MIFIRSQGQLGNQLFLFSAARNVARRHEWLIAVGFLELSGFLDKRPPRVIWIPIPHRFDRPVKRFFKRARLFADRYCDCGRGQTIPPGEIVRSSECRWPLVFEFGLCQTEDSAPLTEVSNLVSQLRSDQGIRNQVDQILGPTEVREDVYGFCHIRLGDYQAFSVDGFSPALPASYYTDALRTIRSKNREIPIIVLSDDVDAAREMLAGERGCVFPKFGERESFWVMMNAHCGVLSASTFSWWGARLASQNCSGLFIAPKYWMGFRAGKWFPTEGIRSSFLHYQPVIENSED